jgi:hypothetical protein
MHSRTTIPTPTPTVATVTMGYGHLRAAAALSDHWAVEIGLADHPPWCGPFERLLWSTARRGYHTLSRLSQGASHHGVMAPVLDRLTRIEHDRRTATGIAKPPFPVRFLDRLIRSGFGSTLGRRLDGDRSPLVATFYANAIAAAHHGRTPVACVVTDSDIHRVWAPRHPAASRIHYLVPHRVTADRLRSYGVRDDRLHVTGFPLPPELVGSVDLDILDRRCSKRRRRLTAGAGDPVTVVFAVGGAGAQAHRARHLIRELAPEIAAGRLRLALVAGTHAGVARQFHRWLRRTPGPDLVAGAIEVLFEPRFVDYYRTFNRLLASADLLWTKPSELVFYGALGLPLVLEAPVGDHERRNRELVIGEGVAVDRPADSDVAGWIGHRLRTGWFDNAAANGRCRLDARGIHAITTFVRTELYDRFTGV